MDLIINIIGVIGVLLSLLVFAFIPNRKEKDMEIFEVLKLLLEDYIFNIKGITLNTKLCEDLHFDDYDFIGLSCDIENTFEILLEDGTDNWETIQDIVNAIEKAKNGK
jgi:acyl carrier protein